jgi:hypothetical protein
MREPTSSVHMLEVEFRIVAEPTVVYSRQAAAK